MARIIVPESGYVLRHVDCLGPEGLRSIPDQSVDLVCDDPPYSKKTHQGQVIERKKDSENARAWVSSKGLGYAWLTEKDIARLAKQYVRICKAWITVMTSHDLFPIWERELLALGHYVFQPVPIVIRGMNFRAAGDGPSSWAVYLVVARPRVKRKWGTKDGGYWITERHNESVPGAKPLSLLKKLLVDYSKPGETVLDAHLGSGTTGHAALDLGRRFIGLERDAKNFAQSKSRITSVARKLQPALFTQAQMMDESQEGLTFYDEDNEVDAAVLSAVETTGTDGALASELFKYVSAPRPLIRASIKRLVGASSVRSEGTGAALRLFPLAKRASRSKISRKAA